MRLELNVYGAWTRNLFALWDASARQHQQRAVPETQDNNRPAQSRLTTATLPPIVRRAFRE